MGREEVKMLASATCNDSRCAIVKRRYGDLWGADYTTMKGLEARGFLKFKSLHRCVSGNGDFIRRSEITETGSAALRASCVPA